MSHIPEVETLSDDNGKSYFRSQRIKSGGKTILTPTKALEPRRAESVPGYDTAAYQVVELFAEFGHDQISSLQSTRGKLDGLESRLRRMNRQGPGSATTLCFTQYKPDERRRWPPGEDLSFLTDLAHSYSEVVPVPSVARALDLGDLTQLFEYVRGTIRAIERLNNKPLMGWIPVAMPRAAYGKLLDIYLNVGVRAFAVDFAGRIPTHLQMRPILAHLAEQRALGGSILYGLNARPGKFIKNAKEIPSRDFFAYGYGLDILGGAHLRSFVPPADTKGSRLGATIAKRQRNRKRIFAAKTYGYHRIDTPADAAALVPARASISAEMLMRSPDSAIEKAYNMDQQRAESTELQRRLLALGKRESVLGYVSQKTLASQAIPNFRRQRALF